ncbi:uncharacterized protein LOC110020042 [Phalaenopsis equestris]|uniref:uncharacterized protein LOC110020042 n=1 Tax=Phalaenopsis equestris TaxID=78828 RepID=UPI0009E234A6|nr:uncharacterized protein LOC110020042 [Phalaenopsis equestris]
MAATKIEREGNVTLSYPLLTKSNYSVWALKMRVNLQAQGVWEAVEQDEVEERKDRMALAVIYQALPEDVLLMVAEKDSAKLAWETLKTMHVGVERVKEAKVQTLRTHFEAIQFMEATAASCQALWLRSLLSEVTGNEPKPVTLYVDNKSVITLIKNPVFHGRSKHIDTRFVSTGEQRADILTKALARVKFAKMRELLGVNKFEPNQAYGGDCETNLKLEI